METKYSLNKEDFINFHSEYATNTKIYKEQIKGTYLFWMLIFITALFLSIVANKDIIYF